MGNCISKCCCNESKVKPFIELECPKKHKTPYLQEVFIEQIEVSI